VPELQKLKEHNFNIDYEVENGCEGEMTPKAIFKMRQFVNARL